MAEIVLNKHDASTGSLQTMARNVVEAILVKIAPIKMQELFLHADWSQPPEYSRWLFNELRDRKIGTTICTDTLTSLAPVSTFFDKGMFIELAISRGQMIPPLERLDNNPGFRFFLAVDTISRDGSLYLDTVAQLPPSSKITVGINWQNRISGPSVIEEEDYSAWAETTVALVNSLSAKKIMAEMGCGLKLCMFSRQQLGLLPNRLIEWPLARCSRSFFYDTDGTLRPCMRLAVPETLSFTHESDLTEVSLAFSQWLAPFSGHCMEADNLDCRSLKTGCCATGCIEHTAGEWHSSSGK